MKQIINRLLITTIMLTALSYEKSSSQTFYSQVNTAWGSNMLGTCSGKTISSHGCAMTCIAMLYGNTYNPGTLNTWLKNNTGYSGGCNIVWGSIPSCQKVKYEGTGSGLNNFSELFSRIKAGQKVVVNVTYIGHPASPGFDHWVLVTGFTGTPSTYNSASKYIVLDPGYSAFTSRTLANYTSGFKNPKYYSIFNSAAPTQISGVCGASPSIEIISWASVPAATGYEIGIKKSSASAWNTYSVTSTGCTFTGLSLNTSYNVRIRAKHCYTYGSYGTFNFSTGSANRMVTGIPELDSAEALPQSSVGVYPNPARTNATIIISLGNPDQNNIHVSIVSMNGQIVKEQNYSSAEGSSVSIQAPAFEGLYILRITLGNGRTETRKILITR